MAPGDVESVDDCPNLHYVDTGMFDVSGYGAVYIYDTARPAVVDTGIGADREHVFDALANLGIDDLAVILPTHVHLDHAGGAGFLAEAFPDAEVLVHERGREHLVDPTRLIEGTKDAVGDAWQHYVEPKPVPADRIDPLADGESVDLGERTLTAHAAPGHAPHQLVFGSDRGTLFTGDAAGIYVGNRAERSATNDGTSVADDGTPVAGDEIRETSPPPQFDVQRCLDDVSMLQSLAPERLCFAHFGPRPYEASLLDRYKRALVEWVEAVRRKRATLEDDERVIEYFLEHTELTDIWGERKGREETRLNVRGVLTALDRGMVDVDD